MDYNQYSSTTLYLILFGMVILAILAVCGFYLYYHTSNLGVKNSKPVDMNYDAFGARWDANMDTTKQQPSEPLYCEPLP